MAASVRGSSRPPGKDTLTGAPATRRWRALISAGFSPSFFRRPASSLEKPAALNWAWSLASWLVDTCDENALPRAAASFGRLSRALGALLGELTAARGGVG